MTLVDTSSWIEALRKGGNARITEKVKKLILEGEAAVCPIVLLELWNGAQGQNEKKHLRLLAHTLPCAEITPDVWERSYEIAQQCRDKGKTIPSTDILIAACADYYSYEIEHNDGHIEEILKIIK